ncbi:MAG: aminotransferase class I/II-fold pyridoxal phosphate-dependent enzyme [Candidatus Omnitrophica bacterium]|nr:aminotransferase class I/II-fold pyridoxal phosphate-dependent enzyme [Candidatus Omnitrophota bacterium]
MPKPLRGVRRLLNEWQEVVLRRGWFRYDFFDGTNRPGLILRYLARAWRQDWVAAYEQSLGRTFDTPPAITFGAGRMALYAILEALDIGPGDEVILPGYTCVVVPNAVLYRGATPVYVDLAPDSFNLDPEAVEAAITPRTKAVLAQHTFGQPCDIEAIADLGRRHRLAVIEDCAHAVGASWNGRRVGTFGDVAFGSTDHTKMFSTVVGGFACTSSAALAARLRAIQRRAMPLPWFCQIQMMLQYVVLAVLYHPHVYWAARPAIELLERFRVLFAFRDELATRRPARYPVTLSNVQAFLGAQELQVLEANLQHRRALASRYRDILDPGLPISPEGAWLRYSRLVASPQEWETRLGKYFVVGRWFSSIANGRTRDWSAIGYVPGRCPRAEYVADHIVNFPTHPRIDEQAIQRFRRLVARSGLSVSPTIALHTAVEAPS